MQVQRPPLPAKATFSGNDHQIVTRGEEFRAKLVRNAHCATEGNSQRKDTRWNRSPFRSPTWKYSSTRSTRAVSICPLTQSLNALPCAKHAANSSFRSPQLKTQDAEENTVVVDLDDL